MSNEITRQQFDPIAKAMQDAGFNPERVKKEISFAIQIINKSPGLQKCSQQSLQAAVLNISNIGLSLNPVAREGYLIPRWDSLNKCSVAVFDPSYIGLVKLLTDSGSVKSMLCQLVYSGDNFEVDLANNGNPVIHKPELTRSKRGDVTGVYALATLIDGTRQVEYMSIEEVNEIRERSETYKAHKAGKIQSCTWITDAGEMTRKTVIKRIYKYLPRTDRMTQIDEAIAAYNSDFAISDAQAYYIESLVATSTLEDRQRGAIEMEVPVMSSSRATEVIEMLKANQQLSDKETLRRIQQSK